jgi:metallo-beta-lactamase family protein
VKQQQGSSDLTSITLGFHGAARTVTGSRYLLTVGKKQTVIDVGLFQGFKELRELNWREPPFPPHRVDQVLLTHSHIDHIGALPRFVNNGFNGPVYCTAATRELARLMLLDSAKIQEEDARYANRKGYSKHKPALPLYGEDEAKTALKLLKKVAYDTWVDLGEKTRARYIPAGHILGSSSIEVRIELTRFQEVSIVFSGDVGRYDMPLHIDPEPCPPCDILICESTYGRGPHPDTVPIEGQLAEAVMRAYRRGGTVLIPAFAVGRSQQLTWILRELMNDGKLPEIPLHIDSPMAVDATTIYSHHMDEHHLDAEVFEDGRSHLFPNKVELHRSTQQSKALNKLDGPRIIISASGMLTGGRVIHHLARLVQDPKNVVIMAGYQAAGTRGRDLLEGAPTIRIHGRHVKVRAECLSLEGLSAHAGQDELVRWMTSGGATPRKVFLTHGEPESSFAFCQHIERELGWETSVPELDEEVDLSAILAAEGSN